MRNVLTTVITCLLLPCISVAAQPTEARHKERVKTSTEQQKPRPQKQERESESRSEPLDFSGTGRPGQQTAGESRGSCVNARKPIEAMLPKSNTGKTVLGYPRFWVYFPEPDKKTEIEFVIQDESRQDIWRSQSSLDSTTGYQSFGLPKTEAPLKVGQWYRWYVKVYCDDRIASTQYVQGWVHRIPLNSKLYIELQQNPTKSYLSYGANRIWYDALDKLLDLYHRYPQSAALKKDWQNLIQAKGVELGELPSIKLCVTF